MGCGRSLGGREWILDLIETFPVTCDFEGPLSINLRQILPTCGFFQIFCSVVISLDMFTHTRSFIKWYVTPWALSSFNNVSKVRIRVW